MLVANGPQLSRYCHYFNTNYPYSLLKALTLNLEGNFSVAYSTLSSNMGRVVALTSCLFLSCTVNRAQEVEGVNVYIISGNVYGHSDSSNITSTSVSNAWPPPRHHYQQPVYLYTGKDRYVPPKIKPYLPVCLDNQDSSLGLGQCNTQLYICSIMPLY